MSGHTRFDRRRFLSAGMALAAAAGVPRIVSAAALTAQDRLRRVIRWGLRTSVRDGVRTN